MFSKAISRGATRNKCRYVLVKVVIEAPEKARVTIDQSNRAREVPNVGNVVGSVQWRHQDATKHLIRQIR